MNFAIALFSLICFAAGFRLARIVPITVESLARARGAMAVIADRGKSEDEKERAAREAAIVLFGRFIVVLGLTVAALVPSALVVVLAMRAGLTDESQLVDALLSPWILAIALALFAADFFLRRR